MSTLRRIFPAWSIRIPDSFVETFVEQDGYWHAFGVRCSVSLSSVVLTDDYGPVAAERIARTLPPLRGAAVDELPPGLKGSATESDTRQSPHASRLLSGVLAADGRALLVTITSDDRDWRRRTWLSIRTHPVAVADDRPAH
jgi:hypothetical protein